MLTTGNLTSALFGALLLLLSPSDAGAYAIEIHDRLPDALNGLPLTHVTAALPDDAGLDRFRTRFYQRAAAISDLPLRSRFLARYPTREAFSSQAFKEFFGMAATMPALGFDPFAAVSQTAEKRSPYGDIRPGAPRTLQEWVRIGSIYPDLDRRNRGRWYVAEGEVQRAPDGEKIPFDPVILNMGKVEPLSGQAHAHYGLNNRPKSDAPGVLKQRPADFAVAIGFPAAPVLTFAPERAQSYGELALLARAEGENALAALYTGNAFHYLGDVGNQIHTIQVGIFDFFVDATLQAWKQKVVCFWGLACQPMERNAIGIDIIGNHHTWSEEMFRIAFQRALEGAPLHPEMAHVGPLFQPNRALMAQWATLPASAPTLQRLAELIILEGNREGPEIYALTRELTTGDLRQAGIKYDFEHETDALVLAKLDVSLQDERLTRFLRLERVGVRRAATAMAFWWEQAFLQPVDEGAIISRLVARQLDELDAAEQRRQIWLTEHQAKPKP